MILYFIIPDKKNRAVFKQNDLRGVFTVAGMIRLPGLSAIRSLVELNK